MTGGIHEVPFHLEEELPAVQHGRQVIPVTLPDER